MRQMLETLGLKERDRFQLFKELKLEWQEQPGLDRRTIMEGFAKFKNALTEENQEKKLLLLKQAGKEFKSYHAASLYCVESLQSLEIKTMDFSKKFQDITQWYLGAAQIHGSPTFLHLAMIYYDFACRSGNQELHEKAYLYAKLGIKCREFSTAALFNAYCGGNFSSTNRQFRTMDSLSQACLTALKKSSKKEIEEKYYDKLVGEREAEFMSYIRTETTNNFSNPDL